VRPHLVICAAAIALVTHAAVYGAWEPHDPGHAYLSWYAPAVALGGVLGVLLLAAALVFRRVLPAGLAAGPLGRRLWSLSLGWLVAQETIEESLVHGSLAVPALDARQLAVALLVSGAGALLAARALGSSLRIVRALLARREPRLARLRAAADRRVPRAPLAWALVWLADATGRRGPPVAA
jgi:hypothetical protein